MENYDDQNDFEYLRVANPDELDILAGKEAECQNLKFGFSPAYIEKLKKELDLPHAFQLLAKKDDEFVGYVSASENLFPNFLYLSELFIEPKFGGQGIASTLVGKVIEYAKSEGLEGVYTQTETENIPAQKLYEKLGFIEAPNPNWEGVTYRLRGVGE